MGFASCIVNDTANFVDIQLCSDSNCEWFPVYPQCSRYDNKTNIWIERITNRQINIYIPNPSEFNNNTRVKYLALEFSSDGGRVIHSQQTLLILLQLTDEQGMLKSSYIDILHYLLHFYNVTYHVIFEALNVHCMILYTSRAHA